MAGPRLFKLQLRSQPERGGEPLPAVKDDDGLERDDRWRHLLLLVHGFNNKESEATAKYAGYVALLQPGLDKSRVAPDAVAALHWPGNEAIGPFSWLDFAGYPVDVKRAKQCIAPLVDFLSRIISQRPARLVSVVGHSLGCRLILEAMCRLDVSRFGGPPLGVVSLMAAAAPVELAQSGQPLSPAPTKAHKVMKAHSRQDWVLWLAFPEGQQLAWGAGYEPAQYLKAIGRDGEPAGFGDSLPRKGNGHGSYWTDEYAANMLLLAMDATLRSLPPAEGIEPRELPPRTNYLPRAVPERKLPS